MSTNQTLGTGRSTVLGMLAVGAVLCGVDAILSDSVTTPARFGGDHRVYGADTVIVGFGWILMGAAIGAKVILHRRGGRSDTVFAVILAITGGLLWLSVA